MKRKIVEYIDLCPVCGKKTLVVRYTTYRMPHLGNVLLLSESCSNCGYKHREIIPLETKGKLVIYFKIIKEEDLYVKIVRSPYAKIKIPELGIEISPGSWASIFITNLEGLIDRLKNIGLIFKTLFFYDKTKQERISDFLNRVKEISKNYNFTLIIEDPTGLSRIIPIKEEQKSRIKITKGEKDG